SLHPVALSHDGPLIEAGVLVGALEFGELVNVHRRTVATAGRLRRPDDHPGGVHVFHHPGPPGHHGDPRIPGHHVFHTGAHDGCGAGEQGHRLALHVGTHQGPVGVVVLQEGDEAGCHRYQLVGRDVHVLYIFGGGNDELATLPGFDHVHLE